jgi:hypothetical protein
MRFKGRIVVVVVVVVLYKINFTFHRSTQVLLVAADPSHLPTACGGNMLMLSGTHVAFRLSRRVCLTWEGRMGELVPGRMPPPGIMKRASLGAVAGK